MAKKLFFAPILSESGTGSIGIRPTGGLTAQSFDDPVELTVTLPDGSAIVADEFGNVLDTVIEEIENVEIVEEPIILE